MCIRDSQTSPLLSQSLQPHCTLIQALPEARTELRIRLLHRGPCPACHVTAKLLGLREPSVILESHLLRSPECTRPSFKVCFERKEPAPAPALWQTDAAQA
eukprot:TRINITY_DN52296_c0_g1_i1.p1 TRINITY_DN52296_c0_g1~~TRINITY_DN52296_c0_g1_i1.p1  ORF type:complete len:101 (+),score=16.55 TRINITY_DN52296_c0_g1_i1:127-429(+)